MREFYDSLSQRRVTSWNQVEEDFLAVMSAFDSSLPQSWEGDSTAKEKSRALSAALQNGKGDWFNDLLALLLIQCSEVESLYVRTGVPGLIVPTHNLDGVYPGDPGREIEFLLEAKMMGTPKHANSPGERAQGRPGSMDAKKRVTELAFKSIDLKGEAARRLTMVGQSPTLGGAGGGDLSTWLHASRPKIFFFMGVRVLGDRDFAAVVRWAETAAQVVDAVGLYCYEPTDSFTRYQRRAGVPTAYELERVLYRACVELQGLREAPPPPIPVDVPPSPASAAGEISPEAD
ncbi:MAG TPA: hypothetical protein VFA11_09665 [Acidimicrobiales bacterium]|nr:hypothetical protein [Acidimicrobiales bacterium]